MPCLSPPGYTLVEAGGGEATTMEGLVAKSQPAGAKDAPATAMSRFMQSVECAGPTDEELTGRSILQVTHHHLSESWPSG